MKSKKIGIEKMPVEFILDLLKKQSTIVFNMTKHLKEGEVAQRDSLFQDRYLLSVSVKKLTEDIDFNN